MMLALMTTTVLADYNLLININQQEYNGTISIHPDQKQNFTCYTFKIANETSDNQLCLENNINIEEKSCILCKEKILQIGAIVSPSNPSLGILMILIIIIVLICLYYYFGENFSLKKWILNNKQKRARKKYYQKKQRGFF